jgi:MerR family transcriptional regulator, thiopeptide resistance regulator
MLFESGAITVYTVKQLSDLAEVSVRTLHHYDQIGLLHPSKVGANGYRYYDDDALLRLQQILFYREIGLELAHIKEIIDSPNFDLVSALRSHRDVLQQKIKRLENLVSTVDGTLMHLVGEMDMSKKQLFKGFSEEEQKQYEREARLQWGADSVNQSVKLWNSYSDAKKKAIQEEGGQVYLDLVKMIEAGKSPHDAEVQGILPRWHNHLRYFYEPTLDILRGLGGGYNSDPNFNAFFTQLHPNLPQYLDDAITQYVDDLETAEIERMLAEDQVNRLQR